jgi:hypothetical protein
MKTPSRTRLEEIRIQRKHTARGCEALFFNMGRSRYGIKAYKTLRLAEECYERQKTAAANGIGPNVGKLIRVKIRGLKRPMYGYQTQKAKDWNDWNSRDYAIFEKQRDRLYSLLFDLGIAGDFGDSNCGIIKGRLVSVDFGSHSSYED